MHAHFLPPSFRSGQYRFPGLWIVAIVMGTSLRADLTSPPAPHSTEWTVMVFMNARNSLAGFAPVNLNQLLAVPASPGVKIVVEWGSLYFKDHVYRFPLAPGMTLPNGTSPTPANVEDIGDTDMGSHHTLEDFISWRRRNFRPSATCWCSGITAPVSGGICAGERLASGTRTAPTTIVNGMAPQAVATAHRISAQPAAWDQLRRSMMETLKRREA